MALRSGHGHRLRLGIAGSNTLALVYEANPSFALAATTPTAIIFVCILSAIIIPLVRQEHNITKLMAPPVTESLQEQRIEELAKEFSLSARETEIVMLIVRGFTTDNVAKKLVISPLHGEHPRPPCVREDRNPQALRADRLHQRERLGRIGQLTLRALACRHLAASRLRKTALARSIPAVKEAAVIGVPDDIRDKAAMTPLLLVIYRFFIGVFVGADYPIATSLITEFTPKHHRAISMGMVSAAWYLGATVAAVVGFALCDVDGGWRLMLGSAIIPCVFLLIGRCKVPESPLWLKSKGRHEEARRVVFRVYGADVILEDEEEEPKHKAGFAEVFSKGYAARIVFLGILTLCQFAPMYAIYTFGPQIMCAFGLGVGKSAILGESVLSLFFLVGSLPAMFWLNSMGRRPPLIRSLFLMAVGLLALGLFPTAPFSR